MRARTLADRGHYCAVFHCLAGDPLLIVLRYPRPPPSLIGRLSHER